MKIVSQKYRVIFFGLGSIGRRLSQLVQEHFATEIYALRTKKGETPGFYGVHEFFSLAEVDTLPFDVAFVTNPTAFHVDTALFCAQRGMNLYIEKPLSDSLKGVPFLLELIKSKKLRTHVGCVLRFDPLLNAIKHFIKDRTVIGAHAVCKTFLPRWRPHRDYRSSYSAKKSLGGGVLLDLIHEPDYLAWLFGPIEAIEGEAGKRKNHEIETEDYGELFILHNSGVRSHVSLDYFDEREERTITLWGEDFTLEGNLRTRTLKIRTKKGELSDYYPLFDRNSLYLAELKHFFECLISGINPMNDIFEHLTVLKPLLAFRERMGL